MWCATSRRATAFKSPSFQIGQSVIQPASSVRNLGARLRSIINDHVNIVIRSCNCNIRQLRAVRSALSRDALRDDAYAIVLLGWITATLYANAPVKQMRRLQMKIKLAVCVVSGRRCFDPITDFSKLELHWLPVIKCVQFKICTMVFKAVHNHSPSYISELIISFFDHSSIT